MAIAQTQLQQQNGHYCEYDYWHSHIPNAETLEAMDETEQILSDIRAGKRKPFSSIEELIADLNSDDEDDIDEI